MKEMIPERVNTIVKAISTEFNHRFQGKANLIWFGSWIKGNAYPQSDIDLAIEYNEELNSQELTHFRNWLDDFPTLYRIDLVDMKSASDLLKQEIKRYGQRL
jgi:predicted nucleotidyltransferase